MNSDTMQGSSRLLRESRGQRATTAPTTRYYPQKLSNLQAGTDSHRLSNYSTGSAPHYNKHSSSYSGPFPGLSNTYPTGYDRTSGQHNLTYGHMEKPFHDSQYNDYSHRGADQQGLLQTPHEHSDFVVLSCKCCHAIMGYQHRKHPNYVVCSPPCVMDNPNKLVANKVQTTSLVGSCSDGRSSYPPSDAELLRTYKNQSSLLNQKVQTTAYYERLAVKQQQTQMTPPSLIAGLEPQPIKIFRERRQNSSANTNDKGKSGRDARSSMSNNRGKDSKVSKRPTILTRSSNQRQTNNSTSNEQDHLSNKDHKDGAGPEKPRNKWRASALKLSDNFNEEAECGAVYVWDANVLTLQCSADRDRITSMQAKIAEYCKKEKPCGTQQISHDDIVFVRLEDNEEDFYRARVLKSRKTKVKVTFIDDGDEASIAPNSCWLPSDTIMEENPVYGLKYTVTPFNPESSHDADTALRIAHEHNFSMKILETDTKGWKGELISTTSNKSWCDLMVKKNKRVKGKSPRVQNVQDSKSDSGDSKDVTPKVDMNLETNKSEDIGEEIEGQPKKSEIDPGLAPTVLETEKDVGASVKSISSEECFEDAAELELSEDVLADIPQNIEDSDNRKLFCNMSLSGNLENGCYAKVNFIWSNKKVTVSAVADASAMNQLEDSISNYIENARPFSRAPVVDEIVIAPYGIQDEESHIHYRGRVVSANDDEEFLIEFIDYGDRSHVKMSELRGPNVEILEHPIYGVIMEIPNVPDEVVGVEADELDQIVTEITVQLQVDQKNESVWTGQLWVGSDRTWTDIVMESIQSKDIWKKSFNPWTTEILDVMQQEFMPNSDCASFYKKLREDVSALDRLLTQVFGPDYLVRFCRKCFRRYSNRIKYYQLGVDTPVGMPHDSTLELWEPMDDLNLGFYYSGSDIPRLRLPIGAKMHFRVTVFRSRDHVEVVPVDDPFFTYQQYMCRKLREFCENLHSHAPEFIPKKHQLCFVNVPDWETIDELMVVEKGFSGWIPKRHRRTNFEEEDKWQAGKWFRGIMISKCDSSPWSCEGASSCYEFWLVDVGRYVPVQSERIVPAVLRYAIIPALATFACLVTHDNNDWPPDLREDVWYNVLLKGTVIPGTVVGYRNDQVVIRIDQDIQQKLFHRNKHLLKEVEDFWMSSSSSESDSVSKLEDEYCVDVSFD